MSDDAHDPPDGLCHFFALVVGDYGRDGHGKTATFYVESNVDADAFRRAFHAGCVDLGADLPKLTKDPSRRLPPEVLERLRAVLGESSEVLADVTGRLFPEPYAALVLAVARHARPDLVADFVTVSEVAVGGYELFP